MRKTLLLILTLLATTAFPAFAQTPAKTQVCQVVAVSGAVEVELAGGTKQAAAVGQYLKEGDIVRTSADSFAILSYDPKGKNIVQISADSEVTIMSVRPADLALVKGEIMAKLAKLGHNQTFEISTPVCVAAVRGTAYSVSHTNRSEVKVFQNGVDVFNLAPSGDLGSESRRLRQGKKLVIDLQGVFSRIENLTNQDRGAKQSFDKRAAQISFGEIQSQNPPPEGAGFEEPAGPENLGNAFLNMSSKPSDPSATELNKMIERNSESKSDSHNSGSDGCYPHC